MTAARERLCWNDGKRELAASHEVSQRRNSPDKLAII